MEKLYKSLTKLPDVEEEYFISKGDGKSVKKTKIVKDRYLLTLLDGNSVALTKEGLEKLGIRVSKELKEEKISEIVTQLEEDGDNSEENNTNSDK